MALRRQFDPASEEVLCPPASPSAKSFTKGADRPRGHWAAVRLARQSPQNPDGRTRFPAGRPWQTKILRAALGVSRTRGIIGSADSHVIHRQAILRWPAEHSRPRCEVHRLRPSRIPSATRRPTGGRPPGAFSRRSKLRCPDWLLQCRSSVSKSFTRWLSMRRSSLRREEGRARVSAQAHHK